MIKCPNCHKDLADDAKFCSECGAPIPSVREVEPSMEMALAEEPAVIVPETEKLAPAPAPVSEVATKRSRKGVFVCMLLAIVAVVCMYIFYGELGFDSPKSKENNAVLYVKGGELFYYAPNGTEVQLTKDLAGAVSDQNLLDTLVKLSSDGKTVFYPDRSGADGSGVSLYCTKIGENSLPIKLGNGIVSYQVLSDGKTVYYLDAEGNLFLHDQKNKTKLRSSVKSLYTTDGMDYLYCQTDGGIYYHNQTQSKQLADDGVELLANGAGMLVCREGAKTYVIRAEHAMEWALPENATQIGISLSGDALYYCEPVGELFDLYSAIIRDDKIEAARLWEGDINGYIPIQAGALAFKDVDEKRGTADLYINGILLGYDVLPDKIGASGNQIVFLADCDENSGTLTLYEGKQNRTIRTDVFDLHITSSGKVVYLADVSTKSGTGDLYQGGDDAVLIASDVSKIVQIG